MTIIRLSIFLILMVVPLTQPAKGLALPEAELSSLLENIPDSSLVPLQRHTRSIDIFGVKRAILQGLIAEMQKLADGGQKTVDDYTKTIDLRTSRFLVESNNTLVVFLKQIRDQIYNAINSGQSTTSNVIQCFYQQEEAADKLVTDIMEHVGQCVSRVARDINYFLQGVVYFISHVVSNIGYLAANIVDCGVATFENFFQVGSCLNNLINTAQWNLFYFVTQLAGGITQAVAAVATIPINLAFCSTENLPDGVRRVSEILNNLGQCAVNATGMQSYSKKTFFGNVRVEQKPSCAYDMLYDKTPYNPKAKRGDRREQKISWRNIWDQEKEKGVPSTSHFVYGRPKRKQYDYAIQEFCRKTEEKEFRSKRLKDALQWVLPLDESKFTPI